jgi:DNA-binding GntR family transcriptional regulator
VTNPSAEEIGDFFLLFQRFEGLLVELAAKRRRPDEIRTLELAQRRIMAHEQSEDRSPQSYAALNRKFHQTMHLMAHSPMLAEKQRSHFNMSDFFITHTVGFGAFMSDAAREHDKIIDAIIRQQPERARLEAESHIAAVASNVLSSTTSKKDKVKR